jgi:hypothetical protein
MVKSITPRNLLWNCGQLLLKERFGREKSKIERKMELYIG